MLTAILVDDEKDSLTTLTTDLKYYCPQVEIIAACSTPLEALKTITREEVDIVFLDIRMPGLTGFELLKIIGEIDFFVIFITSSEDHANAVEAFGIRNANYLPKPIDGDRLIEAVKRVELQKSLQLQVQEPSEAGTDLSIVTSRSSIKWTVFQDSTDYIFVRNDDIIYFQSDGDHAKLFVDQPEYYGVKTADKYIHINDGLGRTADRLRSHHVFYRIHNKYLINLNHVVRVETHSTQRMVHLSNGTQLQVAINRMQDFLTTLRTIR
ncbi:LytR/AlgR family response regulator transcription factor [Flavilitoribacter nigricans]|uniref:Response regulatory domain-containing protein n=1 Tax=Flavilitoribacter nigricans (strain ATCC 23147 / DSM 23189 / NBRC 102662 / NCIMB 1420 / SS-2) TaxID=1122177 RepID=A0A2D0N2L4_FLAN2|nr:response regulator transcription factor [Flavilitoribacter nigricans]PHN01973.1 hypothetical protein CRP01_34270 [Flavilitoribacter nigricans DSM 23189 = NBRC 102662]